jgi:hypothetical protein
MFSTASSLSSFPSTRSKRTDIGLSAGGDLRTDPEVEPAEGLGPLTFY